MKEIIFINHLKGSLMFIGHAVLVLIAVYGIVRIILFIRLAMMWHHKKKMYTESLKARGVKNEQLYHQLNSELFDIKDIFNPFKWRERHFIKDAMLYHSVNAYWKKAGSRIVSAGVIGGSL